MRRRLSGDCLVIGGTLVRRNCFFLKRGFGVKWVSLRQLLVFAVLAVAVAATAGAVQGRGSSGFTTFELAGTPLSPAGVSCPNGAGNCVNYAAEPAIRSTPSGRFFGSSENGLGGGTDAWSSADGGLHYTQLACPNCGSASNTTGFAPGGGDTDLATASAKNALGNYNVYVASLSLANIDVSTSIDNGSTWALNPIGASIPGDDREWIAADGASKVCLSYHDIATVNVDVNCSFDAGATFTQLGEAIDGSHSYAINANEIGNLAIDTSAASPYAHTVYQTFSAVDSTGEQATCISTGPCNYRDVFMGVSTDGGKTFTDHLVHQGAPGASYGHQFVNVSVDQAGNVYSVYSDDHNTYLSYSKDQGKTWSAAQKVNSSATAIEPWSVALAPGKVDIVYYASPYYSSDTTPDSYPSSASWTVGFAQNAKVLSGGSFKEIAATPIVHYGGVCESGIGCTGNRDLYDDFGVAVNPLTGLASIIYSDDQYTNDANNPPQPGCTAAGSNTSTCDHTSIATQTGGAAIN
jgi:hypothetical protein